MSLFLALILYLLTFSNEEYTRDNTCYIDEFIHKDVLKTIKDSCFYLDLNEFSGYTRVKVKLTVKNGYFTEDKLYYGGYYSKPSSYYKYELNGYVTYDSSSYGPKNEEGYDYHTLIFTFAKGGLDYMFVKVPDYNGGYTDIECTTAGLTTGAVAGIVIASLVVVGVTVSFIVYRYRKRNLLYAPTTPAVYTPPLV